MPQRTRRFPKLGPAFLALGTMMAVVFLGLSKVELPAPKPMDVIIPLQGDGKTSIAVTVSRGGTPGMIEWTLKSGTGITMTFPPLWTLREVRGMELSSIVSEAPTKMGRTWTLQAKGTASFWMYGDIRSLQLKNTVPGAPLAIHVRQIYLRENHTTNESFLVTERPLQLW